MRSYISLGSTLVAALLSVVPSRVVAQTAEQPGIIINSGNTTYTCPYTIFVLPSGLAFYTVCGTPDFGQISPSLATKFFDDITAAQPLSQLPSPPCIQSGESATATFVQYKKQSTPVICSPSHSLGNPDSRLTNLYNDAENIQSALGFEIYLRNRH